MDSAPFNGASFYTAHHSMHLGCGAGRGKIYTGPLPETSPYTSGVAGTARRPYHTPLHKESALFMVLVESVAHVFGTSRICQVGNSDLANPRTVQNFLELKRFGLAKPP